MEQNNKAKQKENYNYVSKLQEMKDSNIEKCRVRSNCDDNFTHLKSCRLGSIFRVK